MAQDTENVDGISDDEVDTMIEAEERAEKQQELDRNVTLRAELAALGGDYLQLM